MTDAVATIAADLCSWVNLHDVTAKDVSLSVYGTSSSGKYVTTMTGYYDYLPSSRDLDFYITSYTCSYKSCSLAEATEEVSSRLTAYVNNNPQYSEIVALEVGAIGFDSSGGYYVLVGTVFFYP